MQNRASVCLKIPLALDNSCSLGLTPKATCCRRVATFKSATSKLSLRACVSHLSAWSFSENLTPLAGEFGTKRISFSRISHIFSRNATAGISLGRESQVVGSELVLSRKAAARARIAPAVASRLLLIGCFPSWDVRPRLLPTAAARLRM